MASYYMPTYHIKLINNSNVTYVSPCKLAYARNKPNPPSVQNLCSLFLSTYLEESFTTRTDRTVSERV